MKLLFCIFLIGACCHTRPLHDSIVISTPQEFIFSDALSETFPDGTPVLSEQIQTYPVNHELYGTKEYDGYYLIREGNNETDDCRITRTPLELGEADYLYMRVSGTTEMCSGKYCSDCDFKTGGSCKCTDPTNACRHTIIKNNKLLAR